MNDIVSAYADVLSCSFDYLCARVIDTGSGVAKGGWGGGGVEGSIPYSLNELDFSVQQGVHDRHKTILNWPTLI